MYCFHTDLFKCNDSKRNEYSEYCSTMEGTQWKERVCFLICTVFATLNTVFATLNTVYAALNTVFATLSYCLEKVMLRLPCF